MEARAKLNDPMQLILVPSIKIVSECVVHLDGSLGVANVVDFFFPSNLSNGLNIGLEIMPHFGIGEVPVRSRAISSGIKKYMTLAVLGAPVVSYPHGVAFHN